MNILPRAVSQRRSAERLLLRVLAWACWLLITCTLIGLAERSLASGEVPQTQSFTQWLPWKSQSDSQPAAFARSSTYLDRAVPVPSYDHPTAPAPSIRPQAGVAGDPNYRLGQYTGTIPTAPSIDPQSVPPSYVTGPTEWSPEQVPYEPDAWSSSGGAACCPPHDDRWSWQVLPSGLVWKAYLAGRKESRFASAWVDETMARDLWGGGLWDITLGGRAGILRYGTRDAFRPEGFQVDIEGAGFPRLDLDLERELVSADFRFGVPFTFARNGWEYKFGYYHLSSHLGDEFMVRNPGYMRINYSRDVIVAAIAYRPTDTLRLYTEAGYAFYDDVSQPWEFQFGVDYAPGAPTGCAGAPFAAFNGHLHEEVDFGGNFVAQAGWAWRGAGPGHLFRIGFEYVTGKSTQYEFFDRNEEQVGAALWFDY